MKKIKLILTFALIALVIVAAFIIFLSHPKEVKEIIDGYQKEKVNFESKISQLESERAKVDQIIKDQNEKIINASIKLSQEEKTRLQWKKERSKEVPAKPAEINTLDQARIEIQKLTLLLGKCSRGIELTENSLFTCHNLTLELDLQVKNWELKYSKLEKISKEQYKELLNRDSKILALRKITKKIKVKKAVIYTGIVFAAFTALKLLTSKK